MSNPDVLTDRLRELGRNAPVPAADPIHDVRRGRIALRRRRARSVAGATTVLAVMGVVAANVVGSGWFGDGASAPGQATSPLDGASPGPAASPSGAATKNPCSITGGESSMTDLLDRSRTPGMTAALTGYREAAGAILDPSSTHLDDRGVKRSQGVQAGLQCDPRAGEYLTRLGTSIGWTAGGALGVIRIEVVSPESDQQPDVVISHEGWSPYRGALPATVLQARVVHYATDGGGHAVFVTRTDGLRVAVSASGRWGNNVPPGSPAATDLPTVADLMDLASSPQLVLPARAFGGTLQGND